ncbi:MAG: tRNA pseudouridine(13) synthase TruD [Pseudomonadales bacterium]|nr:tRNA pseudouridine(13) synthase TruD [Pseudomonadales bacterium]
MHQQANIGMQPEYLNLAARWPRLEHNVTFKQRPEDFCVEEVLAFTPSGEGEHVFLWLEKTNLNSQQVIGFIASKLKLAKRDIGYSGLKDKFAHTLQYLSIPWPIKDPLPDLNTLQGDGWRVIAMQRHHKKLKRGVHQLNRFTIKLGLQDEPVTADGVWSMLADRCNLLQKYGFANYFGAQRFGSNANNLFSVAPLLNRNLRVKKAERGMILSAARAYLFNQYIVQRLLAGQFDQALVGDIWQIDGSGSWFNEQLSSEIEQRVKQCELHPMAPLIGRSDKLLQNFLQSTAGQYWQPDDFSLEWPALLAEAGLDTQFRAIRVLPKQLQFRQLDDLHAELSFALPSGSFATALLHELNVQNYRDLS